jgi:hypothetical protein
MLGDFVAVALLQPPEKVSVAAASTILGARPRPRSSGAMMLGAILPNMLTGRFWLDERR